MGMKLILVWQCLSKAQRGRRVPCSDLGQRKVIAVSATTQSGLDARNSHKPATFSGEKRLIRTREKIEGSAEPPDQTLRILTSCLPFVSLMERTG
jgi:hypothetical protein